MDKGYVISKVNVSGSNSHSPLQCSLDEFYNNPESYFNEDYLSMNSPSPKFGFTLFKKVRSPQKDPIKYSVKNYHPSQQKQRKTLITLRDDGLQKQHLSDKEVHDLFDSITKRQSRNKVIEANSPSKACQNQTNALELLKSQRIRQDKVMEELAAKSNRQKAELVMNTSNDYRVKQEARRYMNKYESKKNYWMDVLRQPQIKPYQKVDTKLMFINKGTYLDPKWLVTSLDSIIENVANPEDKDETVNESKLGLDFLLQNSLDHSDLTKVIDKSERLKQIIVEGKSCLKLEYDNFKALRGSKFIKLQYPKEHYDEVVFYQNRKSPNLNKSLIETCKRILQPQMTPNSSKVKIKSY